MNWDLTISFAAAAVAITNPLGKLPVWSELTGDHEPQVRRRIAVMAVITAVVVAVGFLLAGKHLLRFFDIDLASFRIAGGIFLLLTGVAMLRGTAVHLQDREDDGDSPATIARTRFRKIMVPLAIPIMVGPGTITTVIIYGIKATGPLEFAVLSGVVGLVYSANLLVLFTSPTIERRVDPLIFQAITRLFGLVLAAIAVQFMVEGLGEVFPAWLEGNSPIDADVQEARRNGTGG